MTTRRVLFIGSAIGLAVSSTVLVLMCYGVAGVLYGDKINLIHLFWPSSAMLIVGWRSTVFGVMVTVSSVAINCSLYMAIAYSMWRLVRFIVQR